MTNQPRALPQRPTPALPVAERPITAVAPPSAEPSVNGHLIKLGLDLLPLVLFFAANWVLGIFWATALCMAATIVSLVLSKLLLKRVPVMALVTGAAVLVFGSLTLYLQNDLFIKIKPTIVNLLFASAMLGGLAFNQLFVKTLLGDALSLQDDGWRKLQWRWGLFFVFLAVLNEIVWRGANVIYPSPHIPGVPHPADQLWSAMKIGNIPLTFVFMMLQVGLLKQFAIDPHKAIVDPQPPDGPNR